MVQSSEDKKSLDILLFPHETPYDRMIQHAKQSARNTKGQTAGPQKSVTALHGPDRKQSVEFSATPNRNMRSIIGSCWFKRVQRRGDSVRQCCTSFLRTSYRMEWGLAPELEPGRGQEQVLDRDPVKGHLGSHLVQQMHGIPLRSNPKEGTNHPMGRPSHLRGNNRRHGGNNRRVPLGFGVRTSFLRTSCQMV